MAGRAGGAAGGLLSYFTRHATAANLLLVVLVVLGLAAFPRMRAQFFPDVVIDSVWTSVTWEGAGAKDVDAAIVQLLEPAIRGVDGVTDTDATAREGSASIRAEFEPGWDMSRATEDVQTAVDGVTDLPEEVEEPVVTQGRWRQRVTDVVLTGPVGPEQLGGFADEFTSRLFDAGITRTEIRGLAAPETVVEVPAAALRRYDVTMAGIAAAVAVAAERSPAGSVSGADTRVRAGSARRGADQIAGIVLRTDPDGANLTVGDVARIRVNGADRERAYFVGDDPAISLRVNRGAGGDAIAIQHEVERIAADFRATLPEGSSVDLIRTRAEYISGRLQILLSNGLMGLGIVLALLFLFLNARTALWVAAGIPVSMLAAVAAMYAAGLTFNMISLFALLITLGVVVDDAIVVGEHADFRANRLGEGPVEAAETAARRMAAPVFSATITTVIAFLALAAIGGVFGDLIDDIPFTVIAVLLASLVECFLILPHHMAGAIAHSGRDHWYDLPSRLVNRGFRRARDGAFRPLIRLVIRARYPVVALAVAALASQVALFVSGEVTWRFFDNPGTASVSGNFAMVPSATRADSRRQMQEMQRATEAVADRYADEHGRNPVTYAIAQIGGNSGRGLPGTDNTDPDLLGAISIEMISADARPYSSFRFAADLEKEVQKSPLAETVSFRRGHSGPGGDAIDVQLYGAEADALKTAAENLKARLGEFPEVTGLADTLPYDKDELVLDLTPRGRALGFSTGTLGGMLRDRLNGIEAATYPAGPRSATIRVELPEGALSADFLDSTRLRAASGQYVPLADIVSIRREAGFASVHRENGLRVVSVTGDISGDDAAREAEIKAALRDSILPGLQSASGVRYRLSGESEDEREFLADARTGFLLCLVGIYLTLAWIFASWTRPLVVMSVIPFGLVGAIWGHHHWGVAMSMFSVVGLIGMTGIIINDAIVLIATVDEYAASRGVVPAITDAVADRLRPVLLTTLTTVMGLSPLLYETSSQAQFLKPTVITLVYGLGFGMVLVLLVVPAILAMQEDFARQTAALGRGLRAGARARGLWAAVLVAGGLIAALFAATLGYALVFGVLPGVVSAALALPAAAPATATALALFVAGAATVAAVTYGVAALAIALRGRRAAAANTD